MGKRRTQPCPGCEQRDQRLRHLRDEVDALRATVRDLQEKLAALAKDSSTSSKPPSSDIVKPPAPPGPDGQPGRSIGGQPGHPMHQRAPFPPERLAGGPQTHYPELCPACGHGLQAHDGPERVVQQVDIQEVPLVIEEHRAQPGWCPHCQKVHYAALPSVIERGGLVGPRLTALIAFLKGVCHASFSTIRTFLRDVLGVTISRGQLVKVITKVSEALDDTYDEVLTRLPLEAFLNVDETGHKENGDRWWTWCFRAGLYTVFKIAPTRGTDVLLEVLGKEFDGVLGCDYFSSYRCYMRECDVSVQFCLAHLIRDVKFLTTLPDRRDRAYGERLLEALRQLFGVIHQGKGLLPSELRRRLRAARDRVLEAGTQDVPDTRHSRTLAKRFEQHGAAYFEFITTPEVGPTNNLAEQAIRFVVLDRQVTQGTRGENGRRWCERIWTVIATCCQQGRSVFDFLYASVKAWFHRQPGPSLLGTN
jgi:transposase